LAACFGILHDGEIIKEVFIQDILQSGAMYQKGLGIFIAIMISVFIG
jgi:hypothetical protein